MEGTLEDRINASFKAIQNIFQCTICCNTISKPSQLKCGHIFCGGCISSILRINKTSSQCPNCRAKLNRREVKVRDDVAQLNLAVSHLGHAITSELKAINRPVSANSSSSNTNTQQSYISGYSETQYWSPPRPRELSPMKDPEDEEKALPTKESNTARHEVEVEVKDKNESLPCKSKESPINDDDDDKDEDDNRKIVLNLSRSFACDSAILEENRAPSCGPEVDLVEDENKSKSPETRLTQSQPLDLTIKPETKEASNKTKDPPRIYNNAIKFVKPLDLRKRNRSDSSSKNMFSDDDDDLDLEEEPENKQEQKNIIIVECNSNKRQKRTQSATVPSPTATTSVHNINYRQPYPIDIRLDLGKENEVVQEDEEILFHFQTNNNNDEEKENEEEEEEEKENEEEEEKEDDEEEEEVIRCKISQESTTKPIQDNKEEDEDVIIETTPLQQMESENNEDDNELIRMIAMGCVENFSNVKSTSNANEDDKDVEEEEEKIEEQEVPKQGTPLQQKNDGKCDDDDLTTSRSTFSSPLPSQLNLSAISNKDLEKENQNSDILVESEPKRKFIFCPSRLNRVELAKLSELCNVCGGEISREYTDEVTHLIIKLERGRVPQTMKYLFGIADKKWIVTYDWVLECVTQGEMLAEDSYETSCFPDCDSGVRRSRLNPSQLLSGVCIYFPTVLKSSGASMDECKKLVMKMGGLVINTPSEIGNERSVLIIGEGLQSRHLYQHWYKSKGWLSISWSWILDCLLSYRVIPFSKTHFLTSLDGVNPIFLPEPLISVNQYSPTLGPHLSGKGTGKK